MNKTNNKRKISPADAVTLLRAAGAAALLFTKPLSGAFWALYLLCGVSDMIDGPLARRMGTAGEKGAHLDSAADILFGLSLCVLLLPYIHFEMWMIVSACTIAFVRILAYVIGGIKYLTLPMLHTVSNKVSGFALFAFPLLYRFTGLYAAAIILCAITAYSSVEELIITVKSPALKADVKSMFRN